MILFTSVGLSSSNLFASNGLQNAIPHNYLIIEANYTKRLCPFHFQEVVSSREISHVCLLRLKVMYFVNFITAGKDDFSRSVFFLLYWIAKILYYTSRSFCWKSRNLPLNYGRRLLSTYPLPFKT
jgi:hypothetical protein